MMIIKECVKDLNSIFYCCEELQEKLNIENKIWPNERRLWWMKEGSYKFCPFCGAPLNRNA